MSAMVIIVPPPGKRKGYIYDDRTRTSNADTLGAVSRGDEADTLGVQGRIGEARDGMEEAATEEA